jgi:phosphatidylinositol alpha 1,6-mannosyltransferase
LAAEKQVERFRELLNIPNTRIVVIGDGPDRARLESILRSESVTFLGSRSGRELQIAYAAMDVFVHFGTNETFGQTIQEAQASGLAVVAPAAGGPLELIDSGESGFLVKPNQPFTPGVARLIEDASLRLRIAEAGRRRVLGKSWWANNAQLLEHYEWARRHVASREVLDELA